VCLKKLAVVVVVAAAAAAVLGRPRVVAACSPRPAPPPALPPPSPPTAPAPAPRSTAALVAGRRCLAGFAGSGSETQTADSDQDCDRPLLGPRDRGAETRLQSQDRNFCLGLGRVSFVCVAADSDLEPHSRRGRRATPETATPPTCCWSARRRRRQTSVLPAVSQWVTRLC